MQFLVSLLEQKCFSPTVDGTQLDRRVCPKMLCLYIAWDYTGVQGQVR